ncbi:MAG: TerC family protein [Planctomycetes bacterium]|nr:TerC family protein [Planctomycetota bacterium]
MLTVWIAFFVIVVILLVLDLGVFHRKAHTIGFKEAIGWSVVWIAVSLVFNGLVFYLFEHPDFFGVQPAPRTKPADVPGGWDEAVLFLSGYLLEKSLSIDNIFVIALIFGHFRVPSEDQHRVLFWGIVGAIVFRAIMVFAGVELIRRFEWTLLVFGGYLAYAGVKMMFHGDGAKDPEKMLVVRLARRILPIATGDHGHHFVAIENGKRVFTRMLLVLVVIEFTDVVFAVDSVPAVLGLTDDGFIVLTSNVFAILGLRALYFVLGPLMDKFHLLKYSLALILIFIGAKMVFHEQIHVVTPEISLGIIVVLVSLGVGASLLLPARAPGARDG